MIIIWISFRSREREREYDRTRDKDGEKSRERKDGKEEKKLKDDRKKKGSPSADEDRKKEDGKGEEKKEIEDENESKDGSKGKKEPLSLEELLAKKKAEEDAKAKPKFLTKEERAALALQRRQEEVDKMRKMQEAQRKNLAAEGTSGTVKEKEWDERER